MILDDQKRKKIVDRLFKFNPVMNGIFGSYSRNENRTDSELDILFDQKTSLSLLQLVKIERELSESPGVKVDLVSIGGIKNQRLKKTIDADLKIFFINEG